MIIKGGSRSSSTFFAKHLMKAEENERVAIVEMKGLAGETLPEAFREMRLLAASSRADNFFYHASINPREDERLTSAQWDFAVDRLEHNLGLGGHARFQVEHEKTGRTHRHIVWSRIDLDTLTATSDSFTYIAHDKTRAELEQAFNHELTTPTPQPSKRRSREFADWENFRSQESGIDPREVKAEVTELWRNSDSGRSFRAALEDKGYILCKGDRRDFCLVDQTGDLHSLARRIDGVKSSEIRARMVDTDRDELPSVAEASAVVKAQKLEARESRRDFQDSSFDSSTAYEHYVAAQTQNDRPAPAHMDEYIQSVAVTMSRNGGELHHGDGRSWLERASHLFEEAYNKTIEVAKEVVDTTKNIWQEFVEHFPHEKERSHDGIEKPDHGQER